MSLKFYELDEKFGEQMDRATGKRHNQIEGRKFWLYNHWSRLFLSWVAEFCQIDIYGGHQERSFDPRYSTLNKHRKLQLLSRLLYLVTSVRLLINIVFQYNYDYHLLRYDRYRRYGTLNPNAGQTAPLVDLDNIAAAAAANFSITRATTTTLSSETLLVMRANAERAQAALKSVGAPYLNLHFVIQIVYEFLLSSTLTLHVLMAAYYRYLMPFDYSLVRAILDWQTEQRLCNQIVRHEINKIICSSRNFTEVCIEQTKQFAKQHLYYKRKLEQIYAEADLRRFLLDHTLTVRQLEQMALSGALFPANRAPDWVAKLTHYTFLIVALTILYGLLTVAFFASVFFLITGLELNTSILDVVVVVEAGVQVAILMGAGIFYITIIFINCIDQIRFVRELCRLIYDCIRTNNAKLLNCSQLSARAMSNADNLVSDLKWSQANFAQPLSKAQPPVVQDPDSREGLPYGRCHMNHHHHQGEEEVMIGGQQQARSHSIGQVTLMSNKQSLLINSWHTQMNAELLKALVHYKIFVAQIKPITRSFGAFALACLSLMIVSPINVRLHVPYLDRRIKVYAMLFGVLCASCVDLCVVPISLMHGRCLNLYKALSSLLAHAIEVGSHPLGDRVYDLHTIWLLRKELSHPDRLTNQFTIVVCGIRITYSNLLRVHFWVGLISLSIIIETSSNQQEILGALFKDPLRMFD